MGTNGALLRNAAHVRISWTLSSRQGKRKGKILVVCKRIRGTEFLIELESFQTALWVAHGASLSVRSGRAICLCRLFLVSLRTRDFLTSQQWHSSCYRPPTHRERRQNPNPFSDTFPHKVRVAWFHDICRYWYPETISRELSSSSQKVVWQPRRVAQVFLFFSVLPLLLPT